MASKVENRVPRKKAGKPGLVRRRITFGAILIVVVTGLMAVDYITEAGFGLAALLAVAFLLGLREMFRLLEGLGEVGGRGIAYASGLLLILLQLMRHEGGFGRTIPPDVDFLLLVGTVMALLASGLVRSPSRKRLLALVLTSFGVVYMLGLGSFALRLRYVGELLPGRLKPLDLGFTAFLYAVAISKGTDIAAFFTGRYLGRRKLIPWISPGKTIAGGFGALGGGVLITAGFLRWTDLGAIFPWSVAVPLGILLAVVTMTGDLVESLLKRSASVKDSGSLVPEFGGVLDIVDSVLFVLPVVYVAVLIAATW